MSIYINFLLIFGSILISNSISALDYKKIHINRYGKNIELDIFRLNPDSIDIEILTVSRNKTLKQTFMDTSDTDPYFLVCNAGMFNVDYKTNMGYMKKKGEILNSINHPHYHSVMAFNPLFDDLPSFYLYDTDVTPLDSIVNKFDSIVENLRLIKRSGENRWPKQDKKWSELAIGQDIDNNILVIYCHNQLSMFDFNNLILSLPINLLVAQHLEGNASAQLYFSFDGHTVNLDNGEYVPNLLGFKVKKF